MSIRSPSSPRDFPVQARQHIRTLIGKTLAYFAERESDNLKLVREHLFDLVDAEFQFSRKPLPRNQYFPIQV